MVKAAMACILVFMMSGVSLAELVLVEDFESRSEGTIDMQGETTDYGMPIEIWNAQIDYTVRYDSGLANVAEVGMPGYFDTNYDFNYPYPLYELRPSMGMTLASDEFGRTVYATMFLGDEHSISNMGTVYLLYKSDCSNNTLLALNGLLAGYESDAFGDSIEIAGLYQGLGNYSSQATSVSLGAGEDAWRELWIHVDCQAKTARFYTCLAGREPELVLWSGDQEWIPWIDSSNEKISNLKWFVNFGSYPEGTVAIDNIGVDTQGYSLGSLWENPVPPPYWPVFTLDDFIILKQHYGMGPYATWADGDYNGDGWVNLDDFVLLKQHYRTSSN